MQMPQEERLQPPVVVNLDKHCFLTIYNTCNAHSCLSPFALIAAPARGKDLVSTTFIPKLVQGGDLPIASSEKVNLVSLPSPIRARHSRRRPIHPRLVLLADLRLLRQPLRQLLLSYPRSLGAVVLQCLPEPGVLECFLGLDAFLGVVDENAAEEIEELLVEFVVWCDCFL